MEFNSTDASHVLHIDQPIALVRSKVTFNNRPSESWSRNHSSDYTTHHTHLQNFNSDCAVHAKVKPTIIHPNLSSHITHKNMVHKVLFWTGFGMSPSSICPSSYQLLPRIFHSSSFILLTHILTRPRCPRLATRPRNATLLQQTISLGLPRFWRCRCFVWILDAGSRESATGYPWS